MNTAFFLASNSGAGFYSLYDEFCRGKGDYLHIIKGGPGTGKSGFMKKIAAEAEKRGFDTELVLCSGDPDSLDGLYIPALKTGWMDGTAPHAAEPNIFGVDSDYVNLGAFCKLSPTLAEKERISALHSTYKGKYALAYEQLKAAAQIRKTAQSCSFPDQLRLAVSERIRALIQRKKSGEEQNYCRRRFYHAISCKGDVWLNSSLNGLCKQYYIFDNSLGTGDMALKIAAEEAEKLCCSRILSPHPRDTERLEAVLLPETGIGFALSDFEVENARSIRVECMLPGGSAREIRAAVRELRKLEEKLNSMAVENLSLAKALHDELEGFYTASMDFAALDSFTREQTEILFRKKAEP